MYNFQHLFPLMPAGRLYSSDNTENFDQRNNRLRVAVNAEGNGNFFGASRRRNG